LWPKIIDILMSKAELEIAFVPLYATLIRKMSDMNEKIARTYLSLCSSKFDVFRTTLRVEGF